eukprot:scaffold222323_cov36-Cyclotella_meneghiniana.AAC.3
MWCGVRLTADIEKSDTTSVHMPIDATMFIVVPMMMEMIMEEAKLQPYLCDYQLGVDGPETPSHVGRT